MAFCANPFPKKAVFFAICNRYSEHVPRQIALLLFYIQCPVTITIINISYNRIPRPTEIKRSFIRQSRKKKKKIQQILPSEMVFVYLLLQTQQTKV